MKRSQILTLVVVASLLILPTAAGTGPVGRLLLQAGARHRRREEIGSLEPGKRADPAVFDDAFIAQRVMLAGEWV